jgi:anti-sigma B factor antagonist
MAPSSTIVRLPEEIDLANAPDVTDELSKAIATGTPIVIADLTTTDFCDSAGIRALLIADQQATASGAELRLAMPDHGGVPRVIEVMGLERLLPMYPGLDAALAEDRGTGQGRAESEPARPAAPLLSMLIKPLVSFQVRPAAWATEISGPFR